MGIRPEGFLPEADGPFACKLNRVEIMGRDVSIVCENGVVADIDPEELRVRAQRYYDDVFRL